VEPACPDGTLYPTGHGRAVQEDHARRPSRHGRFRLSGAAGHGRARLNSQAKRMEEMSHKSERALLRNQQLAKLREATGTPERFAVDFACARHDRAFRVTFARFSAAQRFRCESGDKSESHQSTTMARLQGLLRPAEALRVRSEDVDFSTMSCAWCMAASGWTLCAK